MAVVGAIDGAGGGAGELALAELHERGPAFACCRLPRSSCFIKDDLRRRIPMDIGMGMEEFALRET